jgi:hypothetical protein
MLRTATWRSGYATVCKTVYSGSIPDVASNSLSRQKKQHRRPAVAARWLTYSDKVTGPWMHRGSNAAVNSPRRGQDDTGFVEGTRLQSQGGTLDHFVLCSKVLVPCGNYQ